MQNEQLSYVIVTPYSMRKSRTGGIIARLISRTGLDLVAARMFAPGKELVERYAETIVTERLKYGQRVKVVGASAPHALRTPEALAVLGPDAFGLPGPYRTIESLNGWGT